MSTIILSIDTFDNQQIATIKDCLYQHGIDVAGVVCVNKKLFDYTYEFVRNSCTVCLIVGKTSFFTNYIKNRLKFEVEQTIVLQDGVKWVAMPKFDIVYFAKEIVPKMTTAKTKYSLYKFSVFGKSKGQLNDLLAGLKYSKNTVKFDIEEGVEQCILKVRISSKLDNLVKDSLLNNLTELLIDGLYSVDGTTLLEQVVNMLKSSGKKIAIAESFTAGGVASTLASVAGASAYLLESLVCYSNQSKSMRLMLDTELLSAKGAVSEEIAYEMAASLVTQTDCDIALATTGYASPPNVPLSRSTFVDKNQKAGRCFIAIGNKQGIRVFEHNFEGERTEIVDKGVQHALFAIYKHIN
ncbi:MAG: CinA family protein [Clostridiales bacterium]|jgi:PncC family amidohydrolase|nr:CinA family protein [Clostridiales bacterium]